MALFFADDDSNLNGRRQVGFNRYRQVLEREFGGMLACGLITLAGFVPFAVGLTLSIMYSSILLLIPAALVGGLFAGPALYGLYDMIFRALRDAPGKWLQNYRAALQKNWKSSLIPGIILCAFLGFAAFAGLMIFWWSSTKPSPGTILLFFLSMLIAAALTNTYWPQLVLFSQKNSQRLRNCVYFSITHARHVFLTSVLSVAYWTFIILFLPWSSLALPITGIWYIAFLSCFLLYQDLDSAFHIEDSIYKSFPDQAPLEDR